MAHVDEKRYTEDERIYKILKSDIVTGKLSPGERIVVSQVEKQLGVSAMPIRSALKSLQQDGLVEIIPYAGAQVMKLDSKQFCDISEIRCILEPYAARLATDRMEEADYQEIEKILKKMQDSIEDMDPIRYSDYNNEFHSYVYDRCGNETLREMIYQLWDRSKITRHVSVMSSSRIKESFAEHKAILELLRKRDADGVEAAFRMNKRNGLEAVKKDIMR